MRRLSGGTCVAIGLAFGLLVGAEAARAATYQILIGAIAGPETDLPQPLTGQFDAATLEAGGSFRILIVNDFALRAGDRVFTRAAPIELEELSPIAFAQPGELIGFYENVVTSALFRSGGELVASSGETATFRFVEFRSDVSDGGSGVGLLGDRVLPRRLHLAGTLHEVEQTFEIRRSDCTPPPLRLLAPVSEPAADLAPADVRFIIVPIVPIPLPCGLWPLFPVVDRVVGRFDLIATAARPIPIDVRPARTNNVVIPGSPGHVPVAILGARPLDVCRIDERSLRLGDGEAEPTSWSGRELTRQRDVDGDGALDLLARFRVRDTGIAFGDDSICLFAQTTCGYILEGCDAIQTIPGR